MKFSDIAIVGFAETRIVDRSEKDLFELQGEILAALLQQTGFEKQEIDGFLVNSSITAASDCFWSQSVAQQLGLEVDFCQSVDIGGSSPLGCVARAAAAIEAGLCNTVALLFADTEKVESGLRLRYFGREFTEPYGLIGAPHSFGLLQKRYEHQYGLDYAALGKLAVTQRNHAILNDNACKRLRKPITVEDYLNSRMIAEPIRLLDCVMPCDGANGLLITRRSVARARGRTRFVVPVGYGERINHGGTQSSVDMTESGHSVAGKRAFTDAGMAPKDVASFHPYDDFIIAIVMQLEALGFCAAGQGSAFVRDNDFGHRGNLPLNTGGGQISAGQPGLAGGGINLVEAVRQLMGEGGARQVANTDSALVTGIGWIGYGRNWSASTALLLRPDA